MSLKIVAIGATGLVGKLFVQEGSNADFISSIKLIGRRSANIKADKITEILNADSQTWSKDIASLEPVPDLFFTGLGTTKAIAGSFENQFKIDHDLNLEVAKAAKEKGIETFVLVSSAGASKSSYLPYLQMKATIEQDIIALEFPRTIILRPGVLLGERETSHGFGEVVSQKITGLLYGTRFAKLSPLGGAKGIDVAHAALEILKGLKKSDKPVVEIYENEQILNLSKDYKV